MAPLLEHDARSVGRSGPQQRYSRCLAGTGCTVGDGCPDRRRRSRSLTHLDRRRHLRGVVLVHGTRTDVEALDADVAPGAGTTGSAGSRLRRSARRRRPRQPPDRARTGRRAPAEIPSWTATWHDNSVIVATVARTHPGTQAPTRVSLRLPSTAGPHPTCGPLTRVAIGAARTPLPTTGLSPPARPARGGIGRGWAN